LRTDEDPWKRARAAYDGISSQRGELGQEAVDFIGGVVVDDPRAYRPVREAEALHHFDRVVVPLPDGVAAVAQPPGRLARAQTPNVEGERRHAAVHRRQAVQLAALRQSGQEALAELSL